MKTPEIRLNRRQALGILAGTASTYIASKLMPSNTSVDAASPVTKPPVALRRVSESADFLSEKNIVLPSAGRTIASLREAQSERTCRQLLVWGDTTQSAKESHIDAYFFGFSDQQAGIDTYNGSSQYFDMLSQYLELVKSFAKREVDMNLTFSIARNAILMNQPGYKPLLGASSYGNQGALYEAMLSRLTIPEPTKRTNKLLIPLVNPDTEVYQIMTQGTDGNPYPGFSTGYYTKYTASTMTSIIFQSGIQNFGPTVIAHEDMYHGLLGNPTHNNVPENPNPNPISIARSRIGTSQVLANQVLDDWDLQHNGISLCRNTLDIPTQVVPNKKIYLPVTPRRSNP